MRGVLSDLSGQTFGRLKVERRSDASIDAHASWECTCVCGNTITVVSRALKARQTVSCGCYRADRCGDMARTHGRCKTPEFRSWSSMITRCYNRKTPGWKNYGGRGIRVCRRWRGRKGFSRFLKDMGQRSPGLTLDRKRFNGNYTPKNCRWATSLTQVRNRRTNRRITFGGQTLTVQEWSEKTGILSCTIRARIDSGWSVKRALTFPVDKRKGPRRRW
jgi:hypothetical protein